MSLAYVVGLGVKAVDLIFNLQLYPDDVFSGSNAEKTRRLWAARETLKGQKADGLNVCSGLPRGTQYVSHLEDALLLVERLSPHEGGVCACVCTCVA